MKKHKSPLRHAVEAPAEPAQVARATTWDAVLDTFIAFLNEV